MKRWLRRAGWGALGLALLGAIVYGFWPQPVEVDLADVTRGPMVVSVNEEGKTRIRERYIVSAPLAGSLMRVQLKAGSPVAAGQTILATLEPGDPSLLNARERAEAEARVKATTAAKQQAEANLTAAKKEYDFAMATLNRIKESYRAGAVSLDELQIAEVREQVRAEQLRAAQFAERVAAFEMELAKAAMLRSEPKSALPAEDRRLDIVSPIKGKVLRVFQESAAIVSQGTQILELGDPNDLELVIDVLSADAVKIQQGNRVVIERWGGPTTLQGRVRLVEPAAFLKISALGVEEQRVNIIADFTDPLEKWEALGDAYRIEARIVVWEAEDVVRVPAGALFRAPDGKWAVFAVREGRAQLTSIKIGQSNGLEAEVIEGLAPGDQVILHPSDQVKENVRVVGR